MSKNIDDKIKAGLINSLNTLGLSEKEAAVYLELLRIGESGSAKIIQGTELHRQFVYSALDTLIENGLVQYVIVRGRKKFSAKNPKMLSLLIEKKKELADELIAKIDEYLVIPDRQQFELYQGTDAFIAHEFDMLSQAKEGSTLLLVGGTGDRFIETLGNRFHEYEYRRTKKNIQIRYIGSEAQRDSLRNIEIKRRLFRYRLLPGVFEGNVNTIILPEMVGFVVFGEPVAKFNIFNPKVSESHRQFFETLWKMGR